MKKLIAIILVAVMCLSLVACGGGSKDAEKALVGEWRGFYDSEYLCSMHFYEDGTCVEGEYACEWEYDKNNERYKYTIHFEGMTVGFNIETKDGVRTLTSLGMFSPCTYYNAADLDAANETN